MKNHFSVLDEITYKGMRPWLEQNTLDEKFASMISDIKAIEPTFQPKYEINFERPVNNKTKYYTKLILKEKIRTINLILEELQEDNTPQLIKYRLNAVLNKKLKTIIKDVGSIIKEQQFELSFINPKKTTFDVDQEHKANTFVFQFLKTSLIHIYLEIQELYKEWIQDELIIEDFYSQLLFEPIPNETYIKEIEIIEVELSNENKLDTTEEEAVSLQSFTYNDYHKNSDKLTDLCDSLKKSAFIHKDTTTSNFKKAFSGKEINTPIVWTGNPTEFSYFIKLIHNTHKLVANLKQDQWKVAVECFVKSDGEKFKNSVRKLDRPAKTGDKLDKAVALLF